MFRPIKKRSFNLLRVVDLFSERWQSTLFQIFYYFMVHSSAPRISTDSVHTQCATLTSFLLLLSPLHFIYPLRKFGWPYLGKATAAARAALPFPNSAYGIFVCPDKGMALTCTQTLMHSIAHEGCTDKVRESALKADSGRKLPCRTGESNLPQWCAGPTLYQLSYIPLACPLVDKDRPCIHLFF